MSTRKRLLLIGSGESTYRQYALRSVAEKADIVLVSKSAPTWELPYCLDSIILDLDDFPAALEQLRTSTVDGVLTYDERYVELSAHRRMPVAICVFISATAWRRLPSASGSIRISSGRISSVIICFISHGTPGTA